MDNVQWSGSPAPVPDPAKWDTITYKYDPSGRRIEKSGGCEAIKYCYDGGNVIAEYDGNDRLLRKYIYGARVDEPVCMIEVVDSNVVYYYHFDGLGAVVALSDSDGDSCQSYEYSVYGQVATEDPNHPNPYMFTGRRFDIETGLYHYRARCYNPHIGRFMQTDPVGYSAGINWYLYCGNNPLGRVDPSGLGWVGGDWNDPDAVFEVKIAFFDGDDKGGVDKILDGDAWSQAADDSYFDVAIDIRTGEAWGYGPNGKFGNLGDFVVHMLGHPEDWAGGTEYLPYLEANPGDYSKIVIIDVYIFDHASPFSIDIADERYYSGDEKLWDFLDDVETALTNTGPDATIHFRGCHIADPDQTGDRSFLKELAFWTGHTVTGIQGKIDMDQDSIGWWLPKIGPDYTFTGGLWSATPSGKVDPLWMNVGPWWHNPWGSQPY